MQKCLFELARPGRGCFLRGQESAEERWRDLQIVDIAMAQGICQRLMVIKNRCVSCATFTVFRKGLGSDP